MRILVITVAGMSTRFSQSLGTPCLKCIYHPADFSESLLYRMICQPVEFDKYIIVGGYMYEELQRAVLEQFVDYTDKIVLVNNERFAEYGSGYSLYRGLSAAMEFDFDEIVFAEGDLFIDSASFIKACEYPADVVTINGEDIRASKSVAFYYDIQDRIHYIYDTGHDAFRIAEPFTAIYNSGQVWKFADAERIRNVYAALTDQDWQGTNLVFVERYFQELSREDYGIIPFKEWINCNTIEDFKKCNTLSK